MRMFPLVVRVLDKNNVRTPIFRVVPELQSSSKDLLGEHLCTNHFGLRLVIRRIGTGWIGI